MKKLLWLICLSVSISTQAQVSSAGVYRISNATTAFGVNLSVGTQVYDVANDKFYLTTSPVSSISTLTSASSSFLLLADINHTHDLGRHSLKAPSTVDGLTAINYRTILYNDASATDYQLSVGYWETKPIIFTDLHDYGSMIGWSGSGANGFIAVDNAYDQAMIGGGTNNAVSWREELIHTGNFSEYADYYGYLDGNETITLTGDVTGSGTTSISTTVGNNSHSHTGSTISGLSVSDFTSTNISNWTNDAGYITDGNTNWNNSYGFISSETDPIYSGDPASGITSTNISNWNTAYSWGNHASQGYTTISNASGDRLVTSNGGTALNGEGNLTFNGSILGLTGDFLVKHNSTEYGFWGTDASSGYLVLTNDTDDYSTYSTGGGGSTSPSMVLYGRTHANSGDIVFKTYYTDASAPAVSIDGPTGTMTLHTLASSSSDNILVESSGAIGTRTLSSLLGEYTETDPVYSGDPASGITSTNITNWSTAHGWGDHSAEGYITGNESITLSGDASGSGTTSISVTIADDSHNHSDIEIDNTLSSDHSSNGVYMESVQNTGTTVNFGDVMRIHTNGNALYADADAASSMPGVYMAVETISAGTSGRYLLFGVVRDDSWSWTVGGYVYVSTSGSSGNTLTQTAPSGSGDQVQIVGIALASNKIYFKPDITTVEIN